MDDTILLKIEASLSLSFAHVPSSFATWTWICLTARSSLGFRGPGFFTESRILVVNPLLFGFSHLLANCDILTRLMRLTRCYAGCHRMSCHRGDHCVGDRSSGTDAELGRFLPFPTRLTARNRRFL